MKINFEDEVNGTAEGCDLKDHNVVKDKTVKGL